MRVNVTAFTKRKQERALKELEKLQPKKLPEPITCDKCEPAGYMSLIETVERIHSYSEEKQKYELVDTSRFSLFRCTNCNNEVYIT